jgi:hypothetical protein
LRHPIDVVEGLAVVQALDQLGEAGHAVVQRLAHTHPAHAVREAAGRRLLGPERETADA